MIKEMEDSVREEADIKAKEIVSQAIRAARLSILPNRR